MASPQPKLLAPPPAAARPGPGSPLRPSSSAAASMRRYCSLLGSPAGAPSPARVSLSAPPRRGLVASAAARLSLQRLLLTPSPARSHGAACARAHARLGSAPASLLSAPRPPAPPARLAFGRTKLVQIPLTVESRGSIHANTEPMEQQQGLSHDELLQASNELTHHALSYVKSMALRCAVELGIADAIHGSGGHVSLDHLLTTLSLTPSKLPNLRRVMRVLTTSGIFAQEDDGTYRLTPVSSLLLSDDGTSNWKSHEQMVLLHLSPFIATSVMNMAEWFKRDEETAFKMTHGADFWGVCGRDVEFGKFFNDAMASDSRFIMDAAIHGAGQVFEGITSLVDVEGGTGAAARALATAFPHIKCTVLDLPQVINDIPADDQVEFVAGNMMDFIPQADALLLKFVLHDWSDKDCVNILKRCKDAIPSREAGGKVIIIDMVVGSCSQAMCHGTQQLFDLYISMLTTGMQRDEKEWCKLFKEAGFTEYKIRSVLGLRSIIEVFP